MPRVIRMQNNIGLRREPQEQCIRKHGPCPDCLALSVHAWEISIDLEYARPMPRLWQTAVAFMSKRELSLLSALPADQQQEAFYLCWTRKEAYAKAKGVGLAQPLGRLDVSMTPGKLARLLSVEGKPEETGRWAMQSFTPAPGYVAALAVEGHGMNATYSDSATLLPTYDQGQESHGMKPQWLSR